MRKGFWKDIYIIRENRRISHYEKLWWGQNIDLNVTGDVLQTEIQTKDIVNPIVLTELN
jgi:hypothetical protein